jgi:hypothetical protein
MVGGKHAGALSADDEAFGTKGSHGFPNDGATDVELTD